MVFNRVVQQRGGDDVGVVDAVVAVDPQRDAQQVVDVGLALPAVAGVQPPGEFQRLCGLLPAGGAGEPAISAANRARSPSSP